MGSGARSPRESALLLLFDIDGTLLGGAAHAHAEALYAALREVHGIDARAAPLRIAPAGRTDPEIARAILLDAGVPAARIDERAGAVREACCRMYARLCARETLGHTVLPGVRELLEWASARPEVIPALLTGNYEPVARLKLRAAGIGAYFPAGQGAFGSDAEDRAALPAIARRRAGSAGAPHPPERTIVVGDTPRDIACAHADGVRCVALATGPFAADELRQADWVVAHARAARELLAELMASAWGTGSASSGPRSRPGRSDAG